MKQTTKMFLGSVALAMFGSGLTVVPAMAAAPDVQEVQQAAGQPVDLTKAAASAVNEVVYIKVVQNSKTQMIGGDDGSDPFDFFFGFPFGGNGGGGRGSRQIQTPKQEGSGSGVIISADGYIVTNNHVVDNADEITVTLNDKREFKARVIGTDKASDLALIKIEASGLPVMPIGDSEQLKVGEWVLAVGSPLNLTSTVTAGIVSAKARTVGAEGIESFIQTDAAINPGNSGGALVNVKGELVGINTMLISNTGSFTGYGFAIPTSIMKKVVSDLRQYGVVQRALLGIMGSDLDKYISAQKDQDKKVPDFGTVSGVYVASVEDDSAGKDAGLEKGDVITGIDGRAIKSMAELQVIMVNHRPGDKVTLTYLRNKKKITKTVVLRNAQGNTKIVKNSNIDLLGVAVKPLDAKTKTRLGVSYGLSVEGLENGRFRDAGISKGYVILKVNGTAMRTQSDLESAFKAAQQTPEQTLFISGMYPSGRRASYAVSVSSDNSNK